ncbi:MAG: MoaD/ThiS family protein [Chloroflexi bacterium]|nr:MoaD/ThiS family protein [Chloroflexota bacterium]
MRNPRPDAGDIRVELLPPLAELIGRDDGRRAYVDVAYRDGETVQDFLLRLGAAYPELGAQLWDDERQQLRQPIELAVNGAVLGIHHQLDSKLRRGDGILLVPQYQGG